jgi:glutathione S-transferase
MQTMTRFTLHGFWRSGPSYKVALGLAMLDEPFSYVHIDLRAGAQKAPDFVAKNRFGQVPCLIDLQNGRSLSQAAVILEYLADVTGKMGGASLEERLQVREWLFWDYDKLSTALYRSRAIKHGFRSYNQPVAELYYTEAVAALQTLNIHLQGRTWVVGEAPTIADINLYGVVFYAADAALNLSEFPHIQTWMKQVENLKGYAKPTELMPTS